MNFARKPTFDMINDLQNISGFAVYISVGIHLGLQSFTATKKFILVTLILHMIYVIKAKIKDSFKKHPLAPCLEIFPSFALTLLEIAFIIETMIESSKSGKSIGCSVAINNRLETSRH